MRDKVADRFINYLKTKFDNQHIAYASPLTKIEGGFETAIYRFQLQGAENAFADPLVLRLYPEYYGSGNAVWESTIQTVLAAQGYPVARTHLLCTDLSVLGGAFFVMDHLPGVPMLDAQVDSVPDLLGSTQGVLHNLDPQPLINSLKAAGLNESRLRFDPSFHWINEKADKFPWIREASEWLMENVPALSKHPVICQGDFHPLNILVSERKVTGVLDWPGLVIADPELGIGNTLVLLSIGYKNLAPTLRPELADLDFISLVQKYLDAYRAVRPYNAANLPYYRVRRCVHALVQGVEGQIVWQHPGIVKDLCDYVLDVTGILIHLP